MEKTPILGTGLSGLVGSKFTQMYQDKLDFTNLDLSTGVDITDIETVKKALENHPAKAVVHFAAFTDVSKAHEEQGNKEGIVYKVNVLGTQNIAKVCKDTGKHLIHISTAYVFDGEKVEPYLETDSINPIEWYGQTKAWAEEEVEKSGCEYTMLRIDQPYREDEFSKLDLLHRLKKGLSDGTLPPMFTDHTFTPTKIETFSDWLYQITEKKLQGLFHATTDPVTTDYDFALKVKAEFGYDTEVHKGSLVEYLKTAKRPYQKNTALDVSKLKEALS